MPDLDSIRAKLRAMLLRREGYRTDVYPDSEKKPTVGIGHLVCLGDNLILGDLIPDARVEQLYLEDSEPALKAALEQASDIGIESERLILALALVNFQLGADWPHVFHDSYPALKDRRYEDAIRGFEESKWARQTPQRADDFVKAIRGISGKRELVKS